ncbi:hypothetical protein BH10BDE1_BH10BDE1_28320 [soil metagenome]
MSKYIGLTVAFLFFASWLYKKLRPGKLREIQSIRTGVSRWTYIVVLIMLFIGGIFTPFGIIELTTEVQRNMEWTSSTGFVTELVAEGTNRGRPTYRARFHYQTSPETGAIDHEVLDVNRSQRPPRVSDSIKVLYDPSNPDIAMIDSFQMRWFLPLVMFLVGIATLGYAVTTIYHIVRLQSLSQMAKRGGSVGANVGIGEGKFIKARKNYLFSFRGQTSWSLVVEYVDLANKKHIAKSEPIWDFHPDTWAKADVPVPLAIDRSDYDRAWVRVQDYFKACQRSPLSTAPLR